jgi:hypothetical protein
LESLTGAASAGAAASASATAALSVAAVVSAGVAWATTDAPFDPVPLPFVAQAASSAAAVNAT